MPVSLEQWRYTWRLTLLWTLLSAALALPNLMLALRVQPSGLLTQLEWAWPLPINDVHAARTLVSAAPLP